MKSTKLLLLRAIALILCFSLIPAVAASAVELNTFPVINPFGDKLVADENTEFITLIKQDPGTKLITAVVQVKHGGSGPQNIELNGIGIEISFNERVAPYAYSPGTPGFDPNLLFSGKSVTVNSVFKKYCKPLVPKFDDFGAQIIQRNASGNLLGTKLSCTGIDDLGVPLRLAIKPGETLSVVEFYFMPVNGVDELDIEMFSYEYVYDTSALARIATWIGNGAYFLQATSKNMPLSATYMVDPGAFKIQMERPQPAVSANDAARTVAGYDPSSMEWSYSENGPFTGGAPVVKDEAHTIYVRAKGDADYSGNDALYGNYKKYLPSAAAAVVFSGSGPKEYMADPVLKKTGENLTNKNGKTRVGDVIKYTITATNAGETGSVWANALLSDDISEFVILDEDSVTAPGIWTFSPESGEFTAELGDIAKGATRTVTFQVTVADNAHGKDITNTVTVSGNDGKGGGAGDLDKTVDEDGGYREVEPDPEQVQSEKPIVDTITEGDKTVTGTGEPGASIVVTLPGGSAITAEVDENGSWSVDIPEGIELGAGDKITVTQTEKGKNPGSPIETVVNPRNTVEVAFDANGGSLQQGASSKTLAVGEPYGALPGAARIGSYYFVGWYTQPTGGERVYSSTIMTVSEDHTLYAHWEYTGGGGDIALPHYTVTFYSNYAPEIVVATVYNIVAGSSVGQPNMPSNPVRDGYAFAGWNTAYSGMGSNFTAATMVNGNMQVYAQWINTGGGNDNGDDDSLIIIDEGPPLAGFMSDHIPYISGYPDNSMKPNFAITRAEVAMIFFRLLSSEEKNLPRASVFSDIPVSAWYTQAVNYLAGIEILTGYPGGDFRPNQQITRAEFATIATRFDNLVSSETNAFPDVHGHWAETYINSAFIKGWVSGYPDGTFKPQQNITRAEVVKVVNTMLDRKIRTENIPAGIKKFNDIDGHWAYGEIVEASNGHDYFRRNDGYETWLQMTEE